MYRVQMDLIWLIGRVDVLNQTPNFLKVIQLDSLYGMRFIYLVNPMCNSVFIIEAFNVYIKSLSRNK